MGNALSCAGCQAKQAKSHVDAEITFSEKEYKGLSTTGFPAESFTDANVFSLSNDGKVYAIEEMVHDPKVVDSSVAENEVPSVRSNEEELSTDQSKEETHEEEMESQSEEEGSDGDGDCEEPAKESEHAEQQNQDSGNTPEQKQAKLIELRCEVREEEEQEEKSQTRMKIAMTHIIPHIVTTLLTSIIVKSMHKRSYSLTVVLPEEEKRTFKFDPPPFFLGKKGLPRSPPRVLNIRM